MKRLFFVKSLYFREEIHHCQSLYALKPFRHQETPSTTTDESSPHLNTTQLKPGWCISLLADKKIKPGARLILQITLYQIGRQLSNQREKKIQHPECCYFGVTLQSVVSFKNLQQFLLLLYCMQLLLSALLGHISVLCSCLKSAFASKTDANSCLMNLSFPYLLHFCSLIISKCCTVF